MDKLEEFNNVKSAQKFIKDINKKGYKVKNIIVNNVVMKYIESDENNNFVDSNESHIVTFIYVWYYKKKNITDVSETDEF